MQDFEPIDVDFVINSEEAKKKAKETKEAIEGVGLTAEKAAERVSDSIQENFYELENSVKQSSSTVTKEVKRQGDALEGMTGRVKRIAADAVDSFELLDPALRKNLQNIVFLENQLESLSSAERQLRDGLKSGTITQGQYNKALAAIRAEAGRAQNSLATLAKEARAGISNMSKTGANAPVDNTLDAQANKLRAVSEQYRGVLQAGLEAYNKLDPAAQKLLTQLIGMEDEMRTVGQAQRDLSQRFEEGAVDARSYAEAMAGLNVRESELRNEIRSTSAELQKQSGVMAAQKPQWNGLQNSINQVARELPAFTYSAQTGFMAISNNIPILVDEMNRLKVANQELSKSGQKGVPVWKQVLGGLLSWQTALMVGVTLLTVYGKEIGNFFSAIFRGKSALDEAKKSAELLNKAFDQTSFKKAIKDVNDLRINIDLAKKGMVDASDVVDQYNATIGKAAGQVNNLKDAEQRLIDNADSYVQMMFYKSAAALASDEVSEKLYETAKKRFELEEQLAKAETELIEQQNRGVQSGLVSNVQSAEMRVRSLQTMLESLASDSQQDVDKLNKLFSSLNETAAGFGLDTFLNQDGTIDNTLAKLKEDLQKLAKARESILITDTAALEANEKVQIELQEKIAALEIKAILQRQKREAKSAEQILSERKKLMDQLIDLDREYARKSFTKEDEEVQALRDKFTKMREAIDEFNTENPASKIDLTGLGELEVKAVEDLTYRQQTNKLKEELDKQKDLYEEYEEYKKQFGIQAAREQFAGQIAEFDSYLDYVKSKIDENQDAYSAVTRQEATGPQVDRVKVLEEEADKEIKAEQRKFNEQLAQLMDYERQRIKLISDYNAQRAALIQAGRTAEAAELDRQHAEELGALDDANLKKMSSYKNLFDGVERLTVGASKKIIAEAKKLVETQQMSAEARAEILKKIAETERDLQRLKVDNILKISGALTSLGGALTDLGASLGNSGIAQAGSLLSGMASGVQDLMTALDSEATAGDIAAAGISGLIKMVDMLSSAAAQRRQAEEQYYRAVIGFQNDYNLSLQEQIRLQSQLAESVFLKDYEGRITDALAAVSNANKEYQESIKELGKGMAITGQRNALDWGAIGQGAGAGAAVGAALGSVVPIIGNAVGAVVGGIVGAVAGLFGGKKKKDVLIPVLHEYPELIMQTEEGLLRVNRVLAESLMANNLVNDETKEILNNILAWDDALEEARQQIKEVISELAGSLSGDLRNALVEAFRNGENAALKMGETVEKVLEGIVSQLIFNRIFSDAFEQLEKEMADSMDLGGDGGWTDDFSRFFQDAKGLTDDFNAAMEAAKREAAGFGFDIFKPDEEQEQEAEKPTGLAGAIRREMTEETASELAGITRGQYDLIKRGLHLNEQRFDLEKRRFDAVVAIMQSNALIERNTALTVEELRLVVIELKGINRNTKAGQSDRDLGIGP